MKAGCVIRAAFPDGKSARAAADALAHEKGVGGARSQTRLSVDGSSLEISIEAGDVVALRAGANACLRALQVFEGIDNEEVQR